MPYKCVHCTAVYEDGASALLVGCDSCKSKFFFYIKAEKLKEIQEKQKEKVADETQMNLSVNEKEQIEKDVREIVGLKEDSETPVFLDFESVRVLKPGKYALDLNKLFSKAKPRVYQLEDGKYIVDLASKKN